MEQSAPCQGMIGADLAEPGHLVGIVDDSRGIRYKAGVGIYFDTVPRYPSHRKFAAFRRSPGPELPIRTIAFTFDLATPPPSFLSGP